MCFAKHDEKCTPQAETLNRRKNKKKHTPEVQNGESEGMSAAGIIVFFLLVFCLDIVPELNVVLS